MENDKSWKVEAHRLNDEYFRNSIEKQNKLSESFVYKGYKGTAKIDLADACLYGKILYIPNLIVYTSHTVKGLREQFEHSVDCYIEHLTTTFGDVTNSYNVSIDNTQE